MLRNARSVEQLTLDFQSRLESLEEQKSLEEPNGGQNMSKPYDSRMISI